MKTAFHFPLVDGAEVFNTWASLLKQSSTGPFSHVVCILFDRTMRRPVTSRKEADKVSTRLTRAQGWPAALPHGTVGFYTKGGIFSIAMPCLALEDLRPDTHSFRVRVGSSSVDVRPLFTVPLAELEALVGEEDAKGIMELQDLDCEAFSEMCIVGDTLHVLSRLDNLGEIAALLDTPGHRLTLVEEREGEGVA